MCLVVNEITMSYRGKAKHWTNQDGLVYRRKQEHNDEIARIRMAYIKPVAKVDLKPVKARANMLILTRKSGHVTSCLSVKSSVTET